ncbi:hypothetical protein V5N11_011163 [Cardamine amara subsp. amara]|uniref:RNase H type-1 domain-containing protein n=1 Tax=Cardamine amara subsp. amara TaxID=228776 RepID=A0ABD0ZJL0_CARAN
MEKLVFSVVISAQKLRPYFQSHPIEVLTSVPLRTILHGPSQSGRLAKWAIELSEYEIEYKSRVSAKAQVLADFLTELPASEATLKDDNKTWRLFVDGSSSKQGCGVEIICKTPTAEIIEQSFRLLFPASNNDAEYEALIARFCLAKGIGAQEVITYCDSQLVVNQFNEDYEVKDTRIEAYLKIITNLAQKLKKSKSVHSSRSDNGSANSIVQRSRVRSLERSLKPKLLMAFAMMIGGLTGGAII